MLVFHEKIKWSFTHKNLTVIFDRICEENPGWVRFFKDDLLVGYIESEDFPYLEEYYEKTLQDEEKE